MLSSRKLKTRNNFVEVGKNTEAQGRRKSEDDLFPALCVLVLKQLDIHSMTYFTFILAAGIEYE